MRGVRGGIDCLQYSEVAGSLAQTPQARMHGHTDVHV